MGSQVIELAWGLAKRCRCSAIWPLTLIILTLLFPSPTRGADASPVLSLSPPVLSLSPPVPSTPQSLDALGADALLQAGAYQNVDPAEWQRLCLYYLADGQGDLALELAEALLAQAPKDILNYWLRLEALAQMNPWGFVAAQTSPAPDAPLRGLSPPPAESEGDARFRRSAEPLTLPPLKAGDLGDIEATLALYIRTRIERAGYRGDGLEEPAAFIERMESLQGRLVEAMASLPAMGPLGAMVNFEVAAWTGRAEEGLTEVEQSGFLARAAPEDHAGVIPFFLSALPDRYVPIGKAQRDWLRTPAAGPYQLAQQIKDADARVNRLPQHKRLGLYEALLSSSAFPFDDDLHLALAREMLMSRSGEPREQVKAHFDATLGHGYRNTSPKAVRAYATIDQDKLPKSAKIEIYDIYNRSLQAPKRPTPWAKPIQRQLGRLLFDDGQYQASLMVLNELIESQWGEPRDYLYLADATHHVVGPQDALTLLDFATAVQERKLAVEAWHIGWGPETQAMKFRLFELGATARHWRIYPRTFISMGGLLLMDGVLLGLCLILFAGLPRISRKGWALGLLTAGGALILQGGSALFGVPMPMGWAGEGAWVLYGALRAFLLGAGAGILAIHIGTPGFSLWRLGRRAFRRRDLSLVKGPLVGLALGTGLLLAFMGALKMGGEPSAYLARLPGVIAGGILQGGAEGGLGLRLSGALWTELVARGLLLGLVGVGIGKLSFNPRFGWALGIMGVSLIWSVVMAGVGEDIPLRTLFLLGEGLILGGVTVRYGLDVAILSQLGAQVMAHFGGLH